MEKTLVILKPDCVRRRMVGAFLTAIESTGLSITKMIQRKMTHDEACELYSEHKGKWHFERNIKHVTSGPVVLLEVEGTNAIARCRHLVETFRESHKDVIQLPRNLVHSTSDPDKAIHELASVGLEQHDALLVA